MAGKTGFVQVKRITKEQREAGITKNIERPGKSVIMLCLSDMRRLKTPLCRICCCRAWRQRLVNGRSDSERSAKTRSDD